MYFRDVIGQDEAKRHLIDEVQRGHVPHARLICGAEGVGKLPLAIAYARYLCCTHPGEDDACGECPSCKMMNRLAHPDVHFVFPVVNKKGASGDKSSVSDDYITEWRQLIDQRPYFNMSHWLKAMGAENQQAKIMVRESDEILRKLSLKSSQGGYKVMIIWLPEKMNQECSNKLLKLLEEPPAQTVFLLVSEEPDLLLTTIQSRTQRFPLHGITEEDMRQALTQRESLQPQDAAVIAHLANGSWLKALDAFHTSDENRKFFELFVNLMRLSYQRKIREMKAWSEEVAGMGRERQKAFLTYCQRLVRENFVYNFRQPDMVYMNAEEQSFSVRFAPFINEKNVMGMMDEFTEAQLHIEQNVNAKMVFFDFALKMIVLLVQK
jgi:DNA polymerase-3 subunit delta'